MTDAPQTEQVTPDQIGHGDVIHDPDSAQWLTVTRVIHGEVKVTQSDGYQRSAAETPLWTFIGDERLDEQISVHADDALIMRRRPA